MFFTKKDESQIAGEKTDLKLIGEAMNEITLGESLKRAIIRLNSLEQRVSTLESKKKAPKEESSRVGSYTPYIFEVLENGKSWSTYSMLEAIQDNHPELPAKLTSLQHSLHQLAEKGIIEKIEGVAGTFRKK